MTTIKLSQLMREGAKHHKQGFGDFILDVEGEFCTCAMGAIAVADLISDGYKPDAIPDNVIWNRASDLYDSSALNIETRAGCPVCFISKALGDTIACLNDEHHWTREQIADWLQEQGY